MSRSIPQVLLLYGPKQSGKTTALGAFIQKTRKENPSIKIVGVIQPVLEGLRHIVTLSDNRKYTLQIATEEKNKNGKHKSKKNTTKTIKTKHYTFDPAAMEVAKLELKNICQNCKKKNVDTESYDYIIIDEVGPLEMKRNQGYEPFVKNLFKYLLTNPKYNKTKVFVVVRESLKDTFASHYGIDNNNIGQFTDYFPQYYQNPETQTSGIFYYIAMLLSIIMAILIASEYL